MEVITTQFTWEDTVAQLRWIEDKTFVATSMCNII